MEKLELGSRMKEFYENRQKLFLTRRTPAIIRLDGKAFHTFTNVLECPFDSNFMDLMQITTLELCKSIQGCKIGYVQSDEISLLLTDYDTLTTDAWFDYNQQKLVSVSASLATLQFNNSILELLTRLDKFKCECCENGNYCLIDNCNSKQFRRWIDRKGIATFDSRAFNIPKEEVCNYFIWRQQDCTRNSINMVAQSEFSHKELQGKNTSEVQDMLMLQRKINWNAFSVPEKRGTCIVKKDLEWEIDSKIPIFTTDRNYIESRL